MGCGRWPGRRHENVLRGSNGDGVEQTTQNIKSRLEARLKEAKVYRSMGLHDESRDVYMHILQEFPNLPAHSRERIQEQIDRIHAETAERNGDHSSRRLSTEELSLIRDKFSDSEDAEDILSRAAAFLEIGQHGEALDAFGTLLKIDFPLERILGNLVECLLRVYGPEEAPARLDTLSADASLGKRERARLKFKLGVELEKLGEVEAALASYRSARSIIPEDLNMRSALDDKIAGLSRSSRYAYLLNQGWISARDLTEAEARAESAGSSVEAVLMDVFGIGKQEIGRSLSTYYNLPFKSHEPNTTAPEDLLTRLDRATLSRESWVPVFTYEREVDVLMEDPGDTAKTERIRALLNKERVNPSVGIREDVQAYIDRFFEALDLAEKSAAAGKSAREGTEGNARAERRYVPAVPEFSYVEFCLPGESRTHRFEVLNTSEHGIGILLRKEDREIADVLQPGSTIPTMTFYAPWTLIRVDATVRHITRITKGRHTGHYLMGVESEDIIESSKVPY